MEIAPSERVLAKVFVGCLLNAELKMHLSQSPVWQHVKTGIQQDLYDLTEVPYKEKLYLGCFFPKESIELGECRLVSERIIGKIQEYCPNFSVDQLKVCLFPQVFIQ